MSRPDIFAVVCVAPLLILTALVLGGMTVRVLKRYFSVITDTLRLRPPAFKSYRHQKQDEDRHRRHHLKRKARLESKLDKGTPYHLGADGEIVFDRNERGELEEDRGR